MNTSDIKKQTSIATRWSSLTEIAARIISPVVNMILARLLTPEAFGVVATVYMITSFADIFTDAGFQKFIVQHSFNSEDELNQNTNIAFWTNQSISVFLYLIIFVFRDRLAALVGNAGLGIVIAVALLSLPITSFSSIQIARFKRDFDFKTLFFVRIVASAIPLVVTVPLAIILRSYWALIIGTLAFNLVATVILTIKSTWKPKWYFNWQQFKGMFSYSWWILLESIAVWITSYIGTFIVGLYLSGYYVGIYKTSMSTVNQIIAIISAATSMPLFVALSRLKDDKETRTDTYCKYMQAISVLVIPLGVGIWLNRGLITDVLLGSQWTEATEFIGLWGLTSSISLILGTYCNGLYNAVGKTKLSFLAQVLHLAALVPVLLVAAPQGFEVLYISRSIVRIELIIVQLVIMKLALKFPLLRLFKEFIPSIVCTVIMFLFNCLIMHIFDNMIWQFICVGLCICIYIAAMFILYKEVLMNAFATFGIKIKHIQRVKNDK